jgi:hypothetical protein
MTEGRGHSLSSSDRPPHKRHWQLPERRRRADSPNADVMNNMKADLRMKLDCFSVSELQPQYVMNRQARVASTVIPRV